MKKIILLYLIVTSAVIANDDLSSHDLLVAALKTYDSKQFDDKPEVDAVSSWLTGLPTVQVSLLNSDNKFGADEYELSINLPFKSPARKKLDAQLLANTKALNTFTELKKALFVSGLIRETIWSYKVAIKKHDIELAKLDWLHKQQSLSAKLVQSGGSNLDLLFVERQILTAQLLVLEFQQEIQTRLKQFQKITGLNTIPEHFVETIVDDEPMLLMAHPIVQQLQLAIQQSSVNYELAGKASNPVNVSLRALDINALEANDRQYGIALEMPIGLRKSVTQADASAWLQEQNELVNQLMVFERQFSTQFSELRGEHKFLNKKQALLKQQAIKTQQIFTKLEQLRMYNEMNQDLFFQRMISLITSIHQAELNQIYINQNQSRQRQLAGVSL